LKVISVNRNIGAFLDWGLAKDLLLPFREQESPVRAGDRAIVHVFLDEKTNRIVASTRLNRHLSRDMPAYRNGQPVNLIIIGRTPLGYNAIVENAHRGLLYTRKNVGDDDRHWDFRLFLPPILERCARFFKHLRDTHALAPNSSLDFTIKDLIKGLGDSPKAHF
jgi:hypothetical protein